MSGVSLSYYATEDLRKAGMVMVERMMKTPASMRQQEGTISASRCFQEGLLMGEMVAE